MSCSNDEIRVRSATRPQTWTRGLRLQSRFEIGREEPDVMARTLLVGTLADI